MIGPVLLFCKQYLKKLKVDKDIKENTIPDGLLFDFRERINFNISYTEHASGYTISSYINRTCMPLDDEDLKYLYEKYSKKLETELLGTIDKLKEEYASK